LSGSLRGTSKNCMYLSVMGLLRSKLKRRGAN